MGRIICLGLLLALLGSMWFTPKGSGLLRKNQITQAPLSEGMATDVPLPHPMPEWGVAVEELICYAGPYIEDGTNDPVGNVAGLVLRNTGETGLSQIVLAVEQGCKTTYFSATWLPPGEAVLALAMERGAFSSDPITAVRVLGVRRQEFICPQVEINACEGGLLVTNLSDEPLAGIRLRHKIYWQDRGIYFGGITQSIWVPLLRPGECCLLCPENYDPETSKNVAIIK